MKYIEFAEAKKAPKKLQRSTRSATKAVRTVKNAVTRGGMKKALLWDSMGMSVDDVNKKMQAFGDKVVAKRKALASKNQTYIANKKIDNTVNDFNKAVQAPNQKTNAEVFLKDNPNAFKDTATPEQVRASQTSRSKAVEKVIKPKGSGKGLLIGAGVAAGTVALGGIGYGVYRKMRSDKGKKRGKYKNFNFPGELTSFSY